MVVEMPISSHDFQVDKILPKSYLVQLLANFKKKIQAKILGLFAKPKCLVAPSHHFTLATSLSIHQMLPHEMASLSLDLEIQEFLLATPPTHPSSYHTLRVHFHAEAEWWLRNESVPRFAWYASPQRIWG